METKELKIQVPDGYEIDKENSTFERIKFKHIKKDITYEDVCNAIFLNEDTYFISDGGYIHKGILPDWDNEIIPSKNIATNEKQLKRLLALNQLLNIAEYYNRINDSKEAWTYYIKHSTNTGYKVYCHDKHFEINEIYPLFNRMEDAQAVIDNPNFREILNMVYKDC